MTSFMGVKEGARTVVTQALQNALTNEFWNSLSPQQITRNIEVPKFLSPSSW